MIEWHWLLYALVFLRVIAFVVAMPIIGTTQMAIQIKLFLAIIITVVVTPLLINTIKTVPVWDDQLWFMSAYQVLLGLLLGFTARFFFFSLSIAGEWVGISSGSSSAQIFNPAQGSSGNVFEQVFVIFASLLFFALNAHHVLIDLLVRSFQVVSPATLEPFQGSKALFLTHFSEMIVFGIKLAFPIVIPILITNVVMGVMARMVPQMNVFVTSLQVTFLMTIVIFLVSLPLLMEQYEFMMSHSLERLHQFVESLDG